MARMDNERLIKAIWKFMDLYGPKDPNYRHGVEKERAWGALTSLCLGFYVFM